MPADAVVHPAAVPDPAASWEALHPANVVGAHHHTQVPAGDAARPDTLHGATKAWAEALGSWVAATTATSVVARASVASRSYRRADLDETMRLLGYRPRDDAWATEAG